MALWRFEDRGDGYIYLEYRNHLTGRVQECGCVKAGGASPDRLLRWVVNQQPLPGDVIQIQDAVFQVAVGRAEA